MLWLVGIYLLISAVSVAVFLGLVIALPATFFSHQRDLWIDHHPGVRWLAVIGRNLLGLAIIALGILLSLPGMPGQGLLTVAIGAVLLDFPGKRRLVRALLQRRGVLDSLNRLRRFFRRAPLERPG